MTLTNKLADPLTDVLRLGDGATVVTPRLVLDAAEETIILLEMLGPKQAVRANWAALMDNGSRTIWLRGTRITKSGMKNHILLSSTLPCGWQDYALLHKQASLKEMNPEQPFYLLSDGGEASPDQTPLLFYSMLNKAMRTPILEDWGTFLWEQGREHNLIQVAARYGIGFAAYRVVTDQEQWETIIQAGLADKAISF